MANINLDESFDFGFSIVDEAELDVLQEVKTEMAEARSTLAQASAEAETLEARLNKLYNTVQPLLNNLKLNSEKSYIYWPNRLSKIEQFEKLIYDIYIGNR